MSRKISLVEKRQWLQEYESGLSEHSLHKKYKKDIRTIKTGLDNARVDRDYSAAKIEMMKETLIKHQGRLIERLHGYQSSVKVPEIDYEVLSWYQGDKSVFSNESSISQTGESNDLVDDMLQQHLKGDKVWKLIEEWRETYRVNIAAREGLQLEIFKRLKRIGYPVVSANDNPKPFLYVNTIGPLFYKWAVVKAFSPQKAANPDQEIAIDNHLPGVMYRGNTLVEAPNNLEETKRTLIKVFRKITQLPEVKAIVETQEALEKITNKTQRAIEEILLIDYIAGDCNVCRRLAYQ